MSEKFSLDKQSPLCNRKTGHSCGSNYMYIWNVRDMVEKDMTAGLLPEEKEYILGGEGLCWGESVDIENFFSRTFQRFSAIAEALWTKNGLANSENHEVRGDNARCLGLKRGILFGTGPLYHQFCDTFPK